jgi:tripartite-type tricarboxylate transporter receptor subunit TctC
MQKLLLRWWTPGATAGMALSLCLPLGAHAAWPERPVKIVVGFAAGGVADVAARAVAQGLQTKYGQAFTIDNKAGAGGRLATDSVAKAEPDGYTLALLVGGDAVLAASEPKLPYQLLRDFRFISTLSVYPFVVVTSAESKVKSLPNMIVLARKTPGGVSYGTPGRGTTQHLAGELIAALSNTEMTDVPYRGTAAVMTDLLTARMDFTISAAFSVQGDIQSGRLKALAVTSKERLAMWPDVPTVSETVPGYEVTTWMGLAAPAKTPTAVVEQLNRDVRELMGTPAVKERFSSMGLDPMTSSSEEMRSRVESELAKWKQLLQQRNIDLTK